MSTCALADVWRYGPGRPTTALPRSAALLVLVAVQAGCAVGYAGVRTSAAPPERVLEIPATARFTLVPAGGDVSSALDRALRERAGVADVRRAKESGDAAGGFVIRIDQTDHVPPLSMASTVLGFLSLAILPSVYVNDARLAFDVTAPGGETHHFEYGYRDWMVSWFPFLLACPDLVVSLDGGIVGEEPRQRALDAIAARFLDDAAPFVAAHASERFR